VQSRLVAYLKVAERLARETFRLRPVLTAQQTLDNVSTVEMVVVDQHRVQHEQLRDRVYYVRGFYGQIRGNQIITVKTTANDTADFRDEVLDSNAAARSVIALREEVAVHLMDYVTDRLLADLKIGRLRADVRRVHDRAEVDSRAFVEEPPDLTRHEGEHTLED